MLSTSSTTVIISPEAAHNVGLRRRFLVALLEKGKNAVVCSALVSEPSMPMIGHVILLQDYSPCLRN